MPRRAKRRRTTSPTASQIGIHRFPLTGPPSIEQESPETPNMPGVLVLVMVGVFEGVQVREGGGVRVTVGVRVALGVRVSLGVGVSVMVGVSVIVGVGVFVGVEGGLLLKKKRIAPLSSLPEMTSGSASASR